MKNKRELKWGLLIGLASLVWLYASFFFGMHTSGIGMIQVTVVIQILVLAIGHTLSMRSLFRAEPETTILEGARYGAFVVVVTAAIAMLAQFGYFKLINPGFTEYMVSETRAHFAALDVTPEAMTEYLAQAEVAFSMKNYVIQSALFALVAGLFFVFVGAVFFRFLHKR